MIRALGLVKRLSGETAQLFRPIQFRLQVSLYLSLSLCLSSPPLLVFSLVSQSFAPSPFSIFLS